LADYDLDRRAERAARNEVLFRSINERIAELAKSYTFTRFVCECDRKDCVEQVEMTRAQYERIRANPSHFFVRAEHVAPEIETVVGRFDGCLIVEKTGVAGEVAEELDPRASSADDE
jgi:hypothetical protein